MLLALGCAGGIAKQASTRRATAPIRPRRRPSETMSVLQENMSASFLK